MNKWKVMLSTVVIAAALSGCGAEAKSQTDMQSTVQQGGAINGSMANGGMRPMGAQADLIGKVKAIDGDTITLFISAMTMGRGARPQGNSADDMPAGGGQPPADGEMPADGERPQAPAGDGAASARGGGRMNMESMFTDETVLLHVSDATKIISRSFENEQMVEKELTLADLKTDDILSVMLKDGTQDADTITLSVGGFGSGGFGGAGGRQRQQQDQQANSQL
ncbi:hypothetical protein FHS15_003546 [Paenibacillus castaneae]|nr:hypothetical protein [Paenibacillus castaneae]NIK78408.1 hypothetical protein [Paenibacillus castaneae]